MSGFGSSTSGTGGNNSDNSNPPLTFQFGGGGGSSSGGFGGGGTSAATPPHVGAGFGDVAAVNSIDSSTPWVAAADGNISLVQQSIQVLNLPITCADENGYTLLHAAASYNHLAIVQWIVTTLREQQQDLSAIQSYINTVDNEGDSALHYCTNRSMAQFLIEQCNIATSIQNNNEQTALAMKLEEHEEMQADEDYDEEDFETIQLKELVEYLQSLSTLPQ